MLEFTGIDLGTRLNDGKSFSILNPVKLRSIKSKRKIRKFAVYDLEWIPGSMELRVAGFYDGIRYRAFMTMSDMLNFMLVPKYVDTWFYAHSGGLHDIQFVLDEISDDHRYEIEAIFNGSSAIIVNVTRESYRWTFIDSTCLFKSSLASIAKSLGMEKTGAAKLSSEEERREWYGEVDIKELIEYNENDCVVLYTAIEAFQLALIELGGQLQATIASCGMYLFRRKYLNDIIRTSELVNEKASYSYAASRVEVFCSECSDAYYYDINSSFPAAMTRTLPGSITNQLSFLRESLLSDDIPMLIQATIRVPESYMPPIPYRHDGRLYFPHGIWNGWFTGVDIALLLREGGDLVKTGETILFEPRHDLRDYAMDMYKKRNETEDKFHRFTYKILLNSFYGKWAEGRCKEKVHIHPSADILDRIEKLAIKMGVNARDRFMKRPGIWSEPVIRKFVPHRHVIVSSYITAIARQSLFDHMGGCDNVHYCDTDGFSTSSILGTGSALGDLKLEKIIDKAIFVEPKVYRIDGEINGKKTTIVKAKGYSLSKMKDSIKSFMDLVSGGSVGINRMRRVKEGMKQGTFHPEEMRVDKRLLRALRPKRYTYPSGETRAWSIDELHDS